MTTSPVSPDLARVKDDLETLSAYREPASPGWTRRVFSSVDGEGRQWVAEKMTEAGLEVWTDTAANVLGRLRGSGDLPGALMTGSHTDTVEGGGRFDGIIGVLGAIEAVRCLREAGVRLEHDLVVADFLGEEPNDFGLSCVGSRAMAGNLAPEDLVLVGPGGATLAEALAAAGGVPAALDQARWAPRDLHCFVELHIEQGPSLEQAGVPIGVVTGIVGIHRLHARFEGRPDHSGTTPMGDRRDAFLGAAEVALAVERFAEGGVATSGRLEIRPGAHNVVPAEADLWAEARSKDEDWLARFGSRIDEEIAAVGRRRRLVTSATWLSREEPVLVTGWVAAAITRAAAAAGIAPLELPSGAGHDATQMARVGPMGMIFVPSRDGRSHCPEEWTDLEPIGQGITVLLETLRSLDSSGANGPAGGG